MDGAPSGQADTRPLTSVWVCVCCVSVCAVQTCAAVCVRAAHHRKSRTRGKSTQMGIAYTHWRALEPRSGALRAWMQPVGGPGTSPPTAIEMQAPPPHALKERRKASTALPDRHARSRSHRPSPPLPPLSPPPQPPASRPNRLPASGVSRPCAPSAALPAPAPPPPSPLWARMRRAAG